MWTLGLVGFGNVGQGLARILLEKRDTLRTRFGFEYSVVFVATGSRNAICDPGGVNLAALLDEVARKGHLRDYPETSGKNTVDCLRTCGARIVAETTPTNLETGEPGLTHIREALSAGSHVVTSNKGPLAVALRELEALAAKKGARFRYEGTVLSGTPVINLAREALAGCDVQHVTGIVNGTTNFVLTRMEEGMEYGEALAEAQRLGYAEADPTADVEGWDAAVKISLLASLLLETPLPVAEVKRRGISGITADQVKKALAAGKRIKLLGELHRNGGLVEGRVSPRELPGNHPLAGVSGAANALTLTTDNLGDVTIVGPGAGRTETGQALLADILAIARETCRA